MTRRKRAPEVVLTNVTAGRDILIGRETGVGWAMPRELPAATPDFVGRHAEIEHVERALMTGSRRALIVGPGGVGKSALAVEVARRAEAAFPDGTLYVDVPRSGALDLGVRLLESVGVDRSEIPSTPDGRASLLRTLLADRQVLVAFDDVDDLDRVRPFIPPGRGCGLLVTSRHRGLPVDGAQVVRLEPMKETEAGELFVRAGGIGDDPRSTATMAVVRACGGLPLALRIAGAVLAARQHWSVADLVAYLHDEERKLHRLRAGDLALHACFNASWAQLHDGARAAFCTAAVVPGPMFGTDLLVDLLGTSPEEVEETFEDLVARHLLEAIDPGVYAFHDLVRLFAREKYRDSHDDDDERRVVQRLLEWYSERLQTIRSFFANPAPLGGHPVDEILEMLEGNIALYRHNFLPTVEAGLESGLYEHAGMVAVAAGRVLRGEGFASAAQPLFLAGAEAGRALDHPTAEVMCRLELAELRGDEGEHREALVQCEAALDVARSARACELEAVVRIEEGRHRRCSGEPAAAAASYDEAAALLCQLGDAKAEATATLRAAEAHDAAGQTDRAEAAFRLALDLASGDPGLVAQIHLSYGMFLAAHDRHEAARRSYREAREEFRSEGDQWNELVATLLLYESSFRLDDIEASRILLDEAIALVVPHGLDCVLFEPLSRTADEVAAGEQPGAFDRLQRLLEVTHAAGGESTAYVAAGIARAHGYRGESAAMIRAFDLAYEAARSPKTRARVRLLHGAACFELGKLSVAQRLLQEAAALLEEHEGHEERWGEACAVALLRLASNERGHTETATDYLHRFASIMRTLPNEQRLAVASMLQDPWFEALRPPSSSGRRRVGLSVADALPSSVRLDYPEHARYVFSKSHETEELFAGFRRQMEAFKEKFGREPGPEDPVFFDPRADEPRPLDPDEFGRDIAAAMAAIGLDPAYIHAYLVTGLLVSDTNLHLLSEEEIAEFNAALDSYDGAAEP